MMPYLYDPEKVLVKATKKSTIRGLVHIEAQLSQVPSKFMANRVRKYLESQGQMSDVGLEWDGETQSAILRTFVSKQFPVDAVGYIQGLLGPQFLRFN